MSCTVLISSSDEKDVKKLKDLLHARAIEVIIDRPGSDTIYDSLKNDLAFIICDVSDKAADGFGTLAIIKRLRPAVPIISISEFSSITHMRRLYELGLFYHAMKPVQTGEIDSIIDALNSAAHT